MTEVSLSSPRDLRCHVLWLGDAGEDGGKCIALSKNLYYYYHCCYYYIRKNKLLMRIQREIYRR